VLLLSDNWVVQNLQNALDTWNSKLSEIWQLVTQTPETFKGGTIWQVILNIHGALQAIGLALLVLFFVVGVVRSRWVSRIFYVDDLALLEITFAPDVVPLITRLEEHFTKYEARLPYGGIGIKVWIYRGDIFAKKA
jgi:hypothetical protein